MQSAKRLKGTRALTYEHCRLFGIIQHPRYVHRSACRIFNIYQSRPTAIPSTWSNNTILDKHLQSDCRPPQSLFYINRTNSKYTSIVNIGALQNHLALLNCCSISDKGLYVHEKNYWQQPGKAISYWNLANTYDFMQHNLLTLNRYQNLSKPRSYGKGGGLLFIIYNMPLGHYSSLWFLLSLLCWQY